MGVLAVHLDPQKVIKEMEALYDAAPNCEKFAKSEASYFQLYENLTQSKGFQGPIIQFQ